MKKFFALFFALFLPAGFLFADPVEGYWLSFDEKTQKLTAAWNIYEDNGTLYGKILYVPDQSDDTLATSCRPTYKNFPVEGDIRKMTVVGAPFIYGLKKSAEGEWDKGSIVDPGDGKIYGCSISFHKANGKKFSEDTLEMRGSIGVFGRSQYWKRPTQEQMGTFTNR